MIKICRLELLHLSQRYRDRYFLLFNVQAGLTYTYTHFKGSVVATGNIKTSFVILPAGENGHIASATVILLAVSKSIDHAAIHAHRSNF